MADITIMANRALSGIQPREIHAGVQSIVSVYSLSRTVSQTDCYYMAKIPDGARVLEVAFSFNVNPFAKACAFNVGTPADKTKFIASVTPSAGLIFTMTAADKANTGRGTQGSGLGWLNDISDSAAQRFTYIVVSCSTGSGTGTTSGALSLIVTYQMDAPNVT